MNRHYGVICNGCTNENFAGKRYKCLVCNDYDLCHYCKDAGICNHNHTQDHPMQCILAKCYYYTEDEDVVDLKISQPLTCPHCGEVGFTITSLKAHVNGTHSMDKSKTPVICPICVMNLEANPNTFITDFEGHLKSVHSPRRLRKRDNNQMGRRGGDPVADLLSQLAMDRAMAKDTNTKLDEPSPFQMIHLVVEREPSRLVPPSASLSSSWLPAPPSMTGWSSIQPPSILKKPSQQRMMMMMTPASSLLHVQDSSSNILLPTAEPKNIVEEKDSSSPLSSSSVFLLPDYLESTQTTIPHQVRKRRIEYKMGLVHSMVFVDYGKKQLQNEFQEMKDEAKSCNIL